MEFFFLNLFQTHVVLVPKDYVCSVLLQLGKSFKDLLDKPPEVIHAYSLLLAVSSSWYEIGIHLNISPNYRDTLKRDVSSDETKLDKIVNEWISSETTDVKWRIVFKTLKSLGKKKLIRNAVTYLEKPDIYSKYIAMNDFTPLPSFDFL